MPVHSMQCMLPLRHSMVKLAAGYWLLHNQHACGLGVTWDYAPPTLPITGKEHKVQGLQLHEHCGWVFWRFDFSAVLGEPPRSLAYSLVIDGCDPEQRLGAAKEVFLLSFAFTCMHASVLQCPMAPCGFAEAILLAGHLQHCLLAGTASMQ